MRKKDSWVVYIFVIIFAFTGIQTDLPTEGEFVGRFLILVGGGGA